MTARSKRKTRGKKTEGAPWDTCVPISSRFYTAGYEVRTEMVDCGTGDPPMEMVNCYTPNGDWIGDKPMAHRLCVKMGLTYIQKTSPGHCVCSIGYSPVKRKWYGWSHRAICGFGIGDMIFKEKFGEDDTPFVRHGSVQIKTLSDAKVAASAFAASVS